ncbi:MAG: DMT family transporter [Rhodospirillales bacterium]|jgi:drug/metabolite transporter (DMT)-like permease|nr:DMT family transporter [Rhodospirillales bacterium]
MDRNDTPGPTPSRRNALAEGLRALSDNLGGVLWMLMAVTFFTAGGLVMKHLAQAVPISMIVFFRNWVVLVVLLPILFRNPPQRLRPQRLWVHVLRAVTGVTSFTCLAYSLRELILADAMALSFTTPLWGIVISAIFLGEAVRARRLSATVLGFAGVLFIVRPQVEIDPAMLVALGGAFLATMSMAYLKQLTASEPPILIMITFSLIATVITAAPAVLVWEPPTPAEFGWLIAVGIFALGGQFGMMRAFTHADVSLVLPLDFLRLPLAAVAGIFVFSEIPDQWTIMGAAIIGVASVYVARPEAPRAR